MTQINWHPWEQATFDAARAAAKPILLSISAVWCHWCHVMDRTTYADPEVIGAINEHFIPVRVDNDQRPDVNARYNMGDWPTTAFLTPEGQTLTGATYVPPEAMRTLLARIAHFYREQRDVIAERAADFTPQPFSGRAEGQTLRPAMVDAVLDGITRAFDPQNGGFGTAPKFPQPEALKLLLLEYRLRKDPQLLAMLETTAIAMATRGMYDHVEGGFFRYSTTPDWSIPHFEKMADDHAGLIAWYAGLVRVSAAPEVRAALASATAYVRRTLRDPQTGLFGGSQDADEAYYALDAEGRRTAQAPYVDRTSYTNWTAALASALLSAAFVLGDQTLMHDAAQSIDAVDALLSEGDHLVRHYVEPCGAPQVSGLLADQIAFLQALIDAHAHTGAARYLVRAVQLAHAVVQHFAHPDGGFVDHRNAAHSLGNVRFADRMLHENALLADALLQLAVMTDDARWSAHAQRALQAFSDDYERAGSFAAPYARAVRRAVSEPMCITIVDDGADPALRIAAIAAAPPLAVVRSFAAADTDALRARGFSSERAAYVCRGTTCSQPVRDAHSLISLLDG